MMKATMIKLFTPSGTESFGLEEYGDKAVLTFSTHVSLRILGNGKMTDVVGVPFQILYRDDEENKV